ncbi:MAG: sugar phosphate isomerase/epimerase [Acidobacteria bacterium]|nr:sugar phosphate isomerase/epimerase [Acidobacteriota bacterium]
MFWPGRDPDHILRQLKSWGVRCGQLGVPGDLDLGKEAPAWKRALQDHHFMLVTVFAGFTGEDYADIPTVQRTVGFLPPSTRAEREARMLAVSDFAAELNVPSIAAHVGFIPEDTRHEDYVAMRELVRRIADHAARHNQIFALETGQEPADALLDFLHDVNRENVGINFDPANMVLYGTGYPIEALALLAEHVVSVHCKDGDWPPKDSETALGVERPLGQGSVGVERFIAKLKAIGYRGPLCIERETQDAAERARDMRNAITILRKLTA